MLAYRLANPLWRAGFKFISRFIMQFARMVTNIEIHPGATIGCGFFVDHGAGVVIGETSVIGRDVTLYQGVTLGGVLPAVDASAQRSVKRHPTIGDNVIIGSGAQVLGNITVNACARVGGNSVVTRDVPEGATVVGVPARQVMRQRPVLARSTTGFRLMRLPIRVRLTRVSARSPRLLTRCNRCVPA